MNQQRKMKRLLSRSAILLTAASFLTLPLATSAFAGKEGVFLSDSVYFTLDKVALSAGAEDGSLRFSLGLNNNSATPIDFNNYGVKVIDTNGVSYTAKLTEKVTARVKAGETGTFKFTSEIPSSLDASQLKVDIFEWNYNAMRDIGALSVDAALAESGQSVHQQAVISLQEIDATLGDNALITAQLGSSYKIYKDGVWMVYSDLVLENLSDATLKLPDGLEFNYQDSKGLTYTATFAKGAGQSLLPQQPIKAILQAAVPASLDTNNFSLLFSPKGKVKTTVLGSLRTAKTFVIGKIGESKEYPNTDDSGLAISTSWAAASKQSDGLHLQANVTLTNKSEGVVTIPGLSAEFQALRGSVAVSSTDNAVRTTYLSPNESTTFRFSGILPAGLNTDALQLVVLEKQAAASTTPQGGTTGSGTTGSGSGTTGNNTNSTDTGSKQTAALPVSVTTLAGAGSGGEVSSYSAAENYTVGTPFKFTASNLIDSNVDVSLVEMGMSENADFGFKTVVAKYKLTNKGTTTLAIPDFQTDLTNAEGYTYSGVRQTTVAKNIAPNTSYVLSYSYLLPGTEKADKLALNLYDANRLSVGSYKTTVQAVPTEGAVSLYPFSIKLNDYSVSATYNKDSSYAYRLRLDLDVNRLEQVITDASFSTLAFEVVDSQGRLLSTKAMSFTGQQKIMSGVQFIDFGTIKSEQLESNVTINMYEVVATPNGDAKRLIKSLKM
ncbi:hypothetical protein GCM10008018_40720 [Paenibacillus marchantiophytorum]|uniref:Uncharacterized protein n=1 Tax=Paenibacillus marchantiophytorum TaxID=1619310 RepID=A0ABQ1EWA9_9BACL|nr:hypothetical protein [Paenibacillus marchantiophytorum]GFZ90318.1 hypothetical protein GCM10008018_40720 [Paenibacillus marchantiophytorum]